MKEGEQCTFCKDVRCRQVSDGGTPTRLMISKKTNLVVGVVPNSTNETCRKAHEASGEQENEPGSDAMYDGVKVTELGS